LRRHPGDVPLQRKLRPSVRENGRAFSFWKVCNIRQKRNNRITMLPIRNAMRPNCHNEVRVRNVIDDEVDFTTVFEIAYSYLRERAR